MKAHADSVSIVMKIIDNLLPTIKYAYLKPKLLYYFFLETIIKENWYVSWQEISSLSQDILIALHYYSLLLF